MAFAGELVGSPVGNVGCVVGTDVGAGVGSLVDGGTLGVTVGSLVVGSIFGEPEGALVVGLYKLENQKDHPLTEIGRARPLAYSS